MCDSMLCITTMKEIEIHHLLFFIVFQQILSTILYQKHYQIIMENRVFFLYFAIWI